MDDNNGSQEIQNKKMRKSKPLYKKWWFWLLIIFVVIFVLPVVFGTVIGLIYAPTDNSSSNTQNVPKQHVVTPAEQAKRNWKKGMIKNKKGIFKINKIIDVQGKGTNGKLVTELLFVGSYKNTSRKAQMPYDFFSDFVDMSTVYKGTKLDVIPVSNSNVPGYENLLENGGKHLLHNQQIDCAIICSPINNEFFGDLGREVTLKIDDTQYTSLYTVRLKPKIVQVGQIS